ncbi:TetR-like C-terminal domain-containing protein [Variovorax ginsengisoli]|uniref:TetR-like C-terminal domain-containing protein n=1 Tax=Variovorax ginsengisoli TaxID=363844 RepID=A0ABT8S131_9BURK|nr:TetR-like C-terminal domain-containing protein [Variovorax ginsengisoli]MDN8613461.1 TetR-like C-terminal domain-containing protein [Variovorax ginsengisoli]MDO1532631.1 TetR-like C-terminal domain-containing protein [Variovorax ginsengisoli]
MHSGPAATWRASNTARSLESRPYHHGGLPLTLLAAAETVLVRDAMLAAMDGVADRRERRHAIAHAYVHFAHDNPALFGLMFRNEIIDMRRPSLSQAAKAAMQVMAPTIGEAPSAGADALSASDAMRVTAAWAYVHGLATLLIDQRLHGVLKASAGFRDPLALVDAALENVALAAEPPSR